MFATRLSDGAEVEPGARGGRHTQLFLELPFGLILRIDAVVALTFWDGPRVGVLVFPERTAWVHEQHLNCTIRKGPVGEQAGAQLRHVSVVG